MPIPSVINLVFLLFVATAAETPNANVADLMNQPVELLLEDGRRPRGVLSLKSRDEWIVLEINLADIVIESRFAKRSVQDMQPITGPRIRTEDIPALMVPPAPFDGFPFPWEAPFPAINHLQAPRSLDVSTMLANWDTDANFDGLLLRVQPRDGWGTVIAVDGHLDVQLTTETCFATGGRTVARNDSFRIAERWSVPIQALDFNADGVVVRLPFRRIQPERDFDIAPEALLTARLRVPTAGTLDARDANVVLRPVSRVRDDRFLMGIPR